MTTLCLCDWVETREEKERRLELKGSAPLTDSRNTNANAEKSILSIAARLMVPDRTPLQLEHLS